MDCGLTSDDCAINDSNVNHGNTENTGMEVLDLCKQHINDGAVDYNENRNICVIKEKSDIKKDLVYDIDSVEILISMNSLTGELNFDVVSNIMLDLLDQKKNTILASSFEDQVRIKYKDDLSKNGANIRICSDVIKQSIQDQDEPKTTQSTADTKRESDTIVTENDGTKNDKIQADILNERKGLRGDISRQSRPTDDYQKQRNNYKTDSKHDVNNHQHSSGSNHWRYQNETAKYDKQHKDQNSYQKNWRGRTQDKRNGYRYNQGYHRRGEYRNNDGRKDTYNKPKNVISFSESDLIYSSRIEHENKNCNKQTINTKKHVTILKRGSTLEEEKQKIQEVHTEIDTDDVYKLLDSHESESTDGDSVPYGKYSLNITSDRKYYSTKYPNKAEQAEDADISGDTEDDNKQKKGKLTKNRKSDKQKPKKPKKKVPKTRIEVFQSQLKAGQLKSIFSRWKTDGLKRIRLTDELHNGTFAMKYKAVYNNETVVLSVYIDQDTSDINAIDMVHMRNCKFIDGIRDCITGPYASLWLLTRYYPNGDLQALLSRDPERHVIGEVHAQFITAGLLFALDYLHQNGIVHGNIKPSKVLISKYGYPILGGYLIVDETAVEERRDVYTPAYAAPERFRGHRGMAIDIFSLGCVAYEIVTGRTPFDDGNLQALRSNILDPAYRPVFEPQLFSYAGEIFIDTCLRKPLKYRFRIGNNRENFLFEEWFSTLDLYEVERQRATSPLLNAMKLIEKSATLDWTEKTVDFNWGRALDITCPYIEPVCKIDWHLAHEYFMEFV